MIEVYAVTEYSDDVAAGIGALMPDLSAGKDARPMDRDELTEIITSPFHDQFVAETDGRIVGAATMSLILGTRKAWLENFVVSASEGVRGQGVGYELWKGIIEWSRGHRATKLDFTSHPSREKAHKFYLRQGATIRDTSAFELHLQD